MNCTAQLLYPQPNCEDMGHLSADPVCFPYKTRDAVTIGFDLNCAFDNVTVSPETLGNFTYQLVTDKVRLCCSYNLALQYMEIFV